MAAGVFFLAQDMRSWVLVWLTRLEGYGSVVFGLKFWVEGWTCETTSSLVGIGGGYYQTLDVLGMTPATKV
jgi:hypothetical protein